MIYDYPTVVVENFFKYPQDVRALALSLDYRHSEQGTYSGKRTESLHKTRVNFFRNVCKKILNSCGIPFTEYTATMHFHLTGGNFGNSGWVHTDSNGIGDTVLASIVYLNLDNNNIDTGTSIYKLNNLDHGDENIHFMKRSFIEDEDNEDEKNNHNKEYNITLRIGSQFNRMIAYDAKNPHAGSGYYGDDVKSSRLTLLTFFQNIQTEDNATTLQRAESNSIL